MVTSTDSVSNRINRSIHEWGVTPDSYYVQNHASKGYCSFQGKIYRLTGNAAMQPDISAADWDLVIKLPVIPTIITKVVAGIRLGNFTPAFNTINPVDISAAAATSNLAITVSNATTVDSSIGFYDLGRAATATRTITATGLFHGIANNTAIIDSLGDNGESQYVELVWVDAVFGWRVNFYNSAYSSDSGTATDTSAYGRGTFAEMSAASVNYIGWFCTDDDANYGDWRNHPVTGWER